MSIRSIREAPAAREVAEFISDFDRPSFGTLRARFRTYLAQARCIDTESLASRTLVERVTDRLAAMLLFIL